MSAELIVPLIRDVAPRDRFEPASSVADRCAIRFGRAIPREMFQEALSILIDAGELQCAGDNVKRVEWDAPERDLYPGLERLLCARDFLDDVGVQEQAYVFHETASGGRTGTGQFSRPDFTLATIRRFRFDPSKHLDVMTFEVKNRAGTNLLGVHEALAHSRFAHYSCVVIPHSKLHPETVELTRDACAEHGLGLITFQIKAIEPSVELSKLTLDLAPVRKSPDPTRVEQFIVDRFPSEKQRALEKMANS